MCQYVTAKHPILNINKIRSGILKYQHADSNTGVGQLVGTFLQDYVANSPTTVLKKHDNVFQNATTITNLLTV
jgi:hypothetical protein